MRWWSWLKGERCATKRVEFERRQRAPATLEPFLTATATVALNCEPNGSSLCTERHEDVPLGPTVCLGMESGFNVFVARCATTLLTLTFASLIVRSRMAFAGDLLRGNTTTHASNLKVTGTFFCSDGSCWCCRSPRETMTKVLRLHLVVLLVSPSFDRNSGPGRHQLTTEMFKASATYLLLFNARFCSCQPRFLNAFSLRCFIVLPPCSVQVSSKSKSSLRGRLLVGRAHAFGLAVILVGCDSIFGRLDNSHLERAPLPSVRAPLGLLASQLEEMALQKLARSGFDLPPDNLVSVITALPFKYRVVCYE